MSSLVEQMEKLSTTRYEIGSAHWVDVTHINKPNSFYVRPTAYRSQLSGLEAHDGPVEDAKLKLRSTVIFKSQKKKRYIRGQIYDIKEENGNQTYVMFSLDYGFMESVSKDKLRNPKRDGMPALALHCELADCKPKGTEFDDKAIEAMVFYVGDERAKMIVKTRTSDRVVVVLINTCPEDIATMMALTGYTTLGYGENIISRMPTIEQPKLFYTYKELIAGDCLAVRVQSGTSLQSFYVCEISEYNEYISSYNDFSMYVKREKACSAEDFKVGKPVAVFNGYKYERAVIKSVLVPEEKAIAQLVDWGKTVEIDRQSCQLKVLPREYYFLKPALAIYCSTDEKQAWDNGLQKFLYPGYQFMIKVLRVGNNLDTPNIVNIARLSNQ